MGVNVGQIMVHHQFLQGIFDLKISFAGRIMDFPSLNINFVFWRLVKTSGTSSSALESFFLYWYQVDTWVIDRAEKYLSGHTEMGPDMELDNSEKIIPNIYSKHPNV